MKIGVGSLNKVKVGAVQTVLAPLGHKIIGMEAPSLVAAQPLSDFETVQGAKNRAQYVSKTNDIGIGLEAGVEMLDGMMYLVNWGVLSVGDKVYYAGGTRLPLPNELVQPILSGAELGHVIDDYSKREDVSSNEGAIGILTADFFNRKENFVHIVKLLWGQYMYDEKRCKKL